MSFIDYNFFPILFFLGWNILTTKQFKPTISDTSSSKKASVLSIFSLTNSDFASDYNSNQAMRWGPTNQKLLGRGIENLKPEKTPKGGILEFVSKFRFLNENPVGAEHHGGEKGDTLLPITYFGHRVPLLQGDKTRCASVLKTEAHHIKYMGQSAQPFNLILTKAKSKPYFTNRNLINHNWKINFTPPLRGFFNFSYLPKTTRFLSSFFPYHYKIKPWSSNIESSFNLTWIVKNLPLNTNVAIFSNQVENNIFFGKLCSPKNHAYFLKKIQKQFNIIRPYKVLNRLGGVSLPLRGFSGKMNEAIKNPAELEYNDYDPPLRGFSDLSFLTVKPQFLCKVLTHVSGTYSRVKPRLSFHSKRSDGVEPRGLQTSLGFLCTSENKIKGDPTAYKHPQAKLPMYSRKLRQDVAKRRGYLQPLKTHGVTNIFIQNYKNVLNTKKLNNFARANFIQKRRSKIRLLLRTPIQKIYSLNKFQIALCFSKILQPSIFFNDNYRLSLPLKIYNSMLNYNQNQLKSHPKVLETLFLNNRQKVFTKPNKEILQDTIFRRSLPDQGNASTFMGNDGDVSNYSLRRWPIRRWPARKKNWYMKTQFFQHIAWNMKYKISDRFFNLDSLRARTEPRYNTHSPITNIDPFSRFHVFVEGVASVSRSPILEKRGRSVEQDMSNNGEVPKKPFTFQEQSLRYQKKQHFDTVNDNESIAMQKKDSEEANTKSFVNKSKHENGFPLGIPVMNYENPRRGGSILLNDVSEKFQKHSFFKPSKFCQNPTKADLIIYGGSWYYENLAFPYNALPLSTKVHERLEYDIGIYSLAHKLSSVGFQTGNSEINIYPFKYNDSYRYNFQNMNLSNYGFPSFFTEQNSMNLVDPSLRGNQTKNSSVVTQAFGVQQTPNHESVDFFQRSGGRFAKNIKASTKRSRNGKHPQVSSLREEKKNAKQWGESPSELLEVHAPLASLAKSYDPTRDGAWQNSAQAKAYGAFLANQSNDFQPGGFRKFLDFQNPSFSKIYAPLFQPQGLNVISFLYNSFLQIIPNSIINPQSTSFISFFPETKERMRFFSTERTHNTSGTMPNIHRFAFNIPAKSRKSAPTRIFNRQEVHSKLPINGLHTNSYPWITQNASDRWSKSVSLFTSLTDSSFSPSFSETKLESSQVNALLKTRDRQEVNSRRFIPISSLNNNQETCRREVTSPMALKHLLTTFKNPRFADSPSRFAGADGAGLKPSLRYIKKPSIFFSSFRHLPYFFMSETLSTKNVAFPQTNLSLFPCFSMSSLRDFSHRSAPHGRVGCSKRSDKDAPPFGSQDSVYTEKLRRGDVFSSPKNKMLLATPGQSKELNPTISPQKIQARSEPRQNNVYMDLSVPEYSLFLRDSERARHVVTSDLRLKEAASKGLQTYTGQTIGMNQKQNEKRVIQSRKDYLQHKSFSLKPLSIFIQKNLGYQTSLFSRGSVHARKISKHWPEYKEKFGQASVFFYPPGKASRVLAKTKCCLQPPGEAIGILTTPRDQRDSKHLNLKRWGCTQKTDCTRIQKNAWKIFPPLFQSFTFRFIDLNLPRTWSSELFNPLAVFKTQSPLVFSKPCRRLSQSVTEKPHRGELFSLLGSLSQTPKWDITQKNFFRFPIPFYPSDFFAEAKNNQFATKSTLLNNNDQNNKNAGLYEVPFYLSDFSRVDQYKEIWNNNQKPRRGARKNPTIDRVGGDFNETFRQDGAEFQNSKIIIYGEKPLLKNRTVHGPPLKNQKESISLPSYLKNITNQNYQNLCPNNLNEFYVVFWILFNKTLFIYLSLHYLQKFISFLGTEYIRNLFKIFVTMKFIDGNILSIIKTFQDFNFQLNQQNVIDIKVNKQLKNVKRN